MSKNEPSRYKPHWGSDPKPDPARCAASVRTQDRASRSYQCRSKPKEGSEWCGIHEPKVAADDAGSLWAVESLFGDEPKLIEVKIARETPKQIILAKREGGFKYQERIRKNAAGEPEVGARTALEAVQKWVAAREKEVRGAESALEKAKAKRAQAWVLLKEIEGA